MFKRFETPFRKSLKTLLANTVLLCALSSCSQMGPKFIEGSRTDYNVAMGNTESEQILLNLVRLRYGDAPYFLEATALNTQFLLTPSVEAGSTFDLDGASNYSIKGKLAYEEKPTVTYSPLRGEDFVRQILSRISLETILLLDSSGWSTERVMRLCVENINGIDNAAKASGPTPSIPPDISDFNELVTLLASLEAKGGLSITESSDQNKATRYAVKFSSKKEHASEINRLRQILGIAGASNPNPKLVEIGDQTHHEDAIAVQTRSFMGVMYFLAQSVIVPEEDINQRKVATTSLENGGTFDWGEVTGKLALINSSSSKPPNAAIAVNYRNWWFYVADSDITTKATFQLLGQLFALQSRDKKGSSPLLTLPIGG